MTNCKLSLTNTRLARFVLNKLNQTFPIKKQLQFLQ
jgi:hypothetical protein